MVKFSVCFLYLFKPEDDTVFILLKLELQRTIKHLALDLNYNLGSKEKK